MTRDQARLEIRSRYAEYLRPAKKRGTFICPICGNGTGSTGDGMSVDPHGDRQHLKCFKCGFYGDLFDLYQQEHGCTAAEAFTALHGVFGISIDADTTPRKEPVKQVTQQVYDVQEVHNYMEYFATVRANLQSDEALKYLSLRGISYPVAARFWLGYDPAWRSPKAVREGKNPPASPRLIIPTSDHSYIARDTRPGVKDFSKMKEGGVELFNAVALYNQQERPVFVTEGEIDALSIIEAGGEAVALGSTSNTRKLLEKLQERSTRATLILCLDNDDAGKKAALELSDGLQSVNVSYVQANICGGHKDPNEALTADREAFVKAIGEAEHMTAAKPDSTKDYITRLLAGEIERFKEGASRKTGFQNLDEVAGGIYPGLYVLGAISSLGKTTFILQLADQMAAAGEHILYFSLEQSRLEMVSKSLARGTALMNINHAVTSLQIRSGWVDDAVLDAKDEYLQRVGDRVSVIEGNFNCTVSFIGDYVSRYMERNGVKPIVIIDYLQILQGDPKQRQTTKEVVDGNVTELKRLSRSKDIPVFVISSLNRSNYLVPVDFESFKESGGIEFTADVVWGLQLSALNEDIFSKDSKIKEKRDRIREAKAENPRKVELVCLKNRYGISSYKASFEYYPMYDLFRPSKDEFIPL